METDYKKELLGSAVGHLVHNIPFLRLPYPLDHRLNGIFLLMALHTE